MGLRFDSPVPDSAIADCTRVRRARTRAGDEVSELSLGSAGLSRSWKRSSTDPFPSYEDLWARLCADYGDLREVLVSRGIPEPAAGDYELKYVNPVTVEEQWRQSRGRHRCPWGPLPYESASGYLPDPDAVRSDLGFAMHDEDGRPVGQLCVVLHQFRGEFSEPLTALTIAARGEVGGLPVEKTKPCFDLAFEWVVRAFASFYPSFAVGH